MHGGRRGRNRRGWVLWGTFLAASAVLLAWQIGWLSLGYEPPESGKLAEENSSSSSARDERTHEPAPGNQSEPVVVAGEIAAPGFIPESDSRSVMPSAVPLETRSAFGAGEPTRTSAIPGDWRDRTSQPAYGVETATIEEYTGEASPAVFQDRTEPDRTGFVRTVGDERPAIVTGEDSSQVSPRVPTDAFDGGEIDLNEIDRLLERKDYAAAHVRLSKIYWDRPGQRPAIRSRIERTAGIIFFAAEPHFMEPYEVRSGDLLSRIGRRYDVPWQYLVRLNRVEPRRIRPGQTLKVVRGPFHAVVDLSDFELTIRNRDLFVKRYPVGIGKDATSPVGRFTVRDKVVDPDYTDPMNRVIPGEDPSNPIGERWIALGQGYGIHGTIEPDSIGKAESRGCIRMLNEDIEEVYDMLGIGSEVVIQE